MSEIVQPILAVLYGEKVCLEDVQEELEKRWGSVDYQSEPVPFDVTDYYEKEMGKDLVRSIWSFTDQMSAANLVRRKQEAMTIEEEFASAGKRSVNLDPGYMDTSKVVLASTKFDGQKIFLGEGIYADMILFYEKGEWTSLPWTFPDFEDGRYDDALLNIRTNWKRKRRGT